MSIPVTCDRCFQSFRVKAEFAGRTIRCKECGAAMAVPWEGEVPADDFVKSGRRNSVRKKRPSAAPRIAGIVVGAVIGVAVLGGGIWFVVSRIGDSTKAKSTEGDESAASDASGNGLAEWSPNPNVEARLNAASTDFAGYKIRVPKGYSPEIARLPPSPPGFKVHGIAWIGPLRTDGTRAQVMLNTIQMPPQARNRYSAEELLNRRLSAFENLYSDWSRTEISRGRVNGITFVRAGYSGVSKQYGRKVIGFLYVSKHNDEFIYLSTQDAEPHHRDSLPVGEASIFTFSR